MRDILYKAKRKDNGDWVEGDILKCDEQCFIIPRMGVCCVEDYPHAITNKFIQLYAYEVEPKTVCQYTEMNDKNKEKIFENDIIRALVPIYKLRQGKPIGERWLVGVVILDKNDGSYPRNWVISAKDEHENPTSYIFTNKFEIIGNIFDNPELLS